MQDEIFQTPEMDILASEGVRTAEWKYFSYINYKSSEELYNLSNDPEEIKNLAKSKKFHSNLIALRTKCDNLIRKYRDPYSGAPAGLMVEYIREPKNVAINDKLPEYSWIVPKEAVYQNAYFSYFNYGESSFTSSDTILNQIWDLCKYSMKATSATGYYIDGEGSGHSSLHSNMMPLAFGIVPEANQKTVVEFVKSRRMACSVYGAQYLLEGLYEAGEGQYALDLMRTTYDRSWWNMIKTGSTITMEAWDMKYKPNSDWNHDWGTVPANIIPRYIWGITPKNPAFELIQIKPQHVSEDWVLYIAE